MKDVDFSKFQQYTKDVSRVIDKITLTTSKQLGFPQAFSNRHDIKNYTGIVIYWYAEIEAMIVRFTKNTEEKGYLKLIHSEKYGAHASISTFLSTYSLDPKNYERRYDYEVIAPEKMGVTSTDKLFMITLKKKESDERTP